MNKLSEIVSKFAPVLGSVIPLPGASIIGNAIGAAFGATDEKELISKINLSEDSQVKLLQIERDHVSTIAKIISDEHVARVQSEVQDRDSARKMGVDLKSSVPSVLTYIVTIGFFAIVLALFGSPIPPENESIVYTLVGCYTTVFLSCIAYWFGTSFTSQKKDNMIYNSAPLEKK